MERKLTTPAGQASLCYMADADYSAVGLISTSLETGDQLIYRLAFRCLIFLAHDPTMALAAEVAKQILPIMDKLTSLWPNEGTQHRLSLPS